MCKILFLRWRTDIANVIRAYFNDKPGTRVTNSPYQRHCLRPRGMLPKGGNYIVYLPVVFFFNGFDRVKMKLSVLKQSEVWKAIRVKTTSSFVILGKL